MKFGIHIGHMGGPLAERRDVAIAANPITYVTKDDPPFLQLA